MYIDPKILNNNSLWTRPPLFSHNTPKKTHQQKPSPKPNHRNNHRNKTAGIFLFLQGGFVGSRGHGLIGDAWNTSSFGSTRSSRTGDEDEVRTGDDLHLDFWCCAGDFRRGFFNEKNLEDDPMTMVSLKES